MSLLTDPVTFKKKREIGNARGSNVIFTQAGSIPVLAGIQIRALLSRAVSLSPIRRGNHNHTF